MTSVLPLTHEDHVLESRILVIKWSINFQITTRQLRSCTKQQFRRNPKVLYRKTLVLSNDKITISYHVPRSARTAEHWRPSTRRNE